jgi:protoporphyrinogen/coproporphyrinogen III oxidase
MSGSSTTLRVAVIGGGITGLAAAHRLREIDPAIEVILFEAGASLGGVLQTERRGGYLLELAADNFITNVPWAVDLCRRIGFADQLLAPNAQHRRALVVHDGQLYPVPEGFLLMQPSRMWPILASPLLSVRGKLRLLAERFVPPRRETGDESLASFARRRLGREAFDRLVQPLASGIYTADAEQLSLAATLPRFIDMERRHGSLIKAALRERQADAAEDAGARYSLFAAPRDGMASLVSALAARLPEGAVRLHSPVGALRRQPDGTWFVCLMGGTQDPPSLPRERPGEGHTPQRTNAQTQDSFDAVILAAPAPQAATIVESFDRSLAGELRSIPYAGTAIALVAYAEGQIARPLDGFGFVVPQIDGRRILSTSFSSVKYVGRAPRGHVLLRVFLGGAARPELVAASDEELRAIVFDELGQLLGIRGEPSLFQVARWPNAMPQYHLGHLQRVARIDVALERWPGLQLAGNAFHGVGIPHCIHSGEQAAERVMQSLTK